MAEKILNPFHAKEWVTSACSNLRIYIGGCRGNRVSFIVYEFDPDENDFWEVETRVGEWEDIPAMIEEWESEIYEQIEAEVIQVDFRGPMR